MCGHMHVTHLARNARDVARHFPSVKLNVKLRDWYPLDGNTGREAHVCGHGESEVDNLEYE